MTVFNTPLVSIIIPTYNHAHYLGRALQSVFDQTYLNWEVIIIDNNSTDNTSDLVASFLDYHVNYFKINNNGVIAASRNMGLRAAKGVWVAFLDSDDWWSLNKLEMCLKYAKDDVDLIHHNLDITYDNTHFLSRTVTRGRHLKPPVLKDLLLKGNPIVNSTVVVRKDVLIKVGGVNEDQSMIASEDYNLWLRVSAATDRFRYVPVSLGGYQIHRSAVSQRDMSISNFAAISEFEDNLTEGELKGVHKFLNYISGRFNYLKKNYSTASVSLKKSLTLKKPKLLLKTMWMLIIIYIQNTKYP